MKGGFCFVSEKGLALLIALLEVLSECERRAMDVLFEALVKVGERGKSALFCDFLDGEVEIAFQEFVKAALFLCVKKVTARFSSYIAF